VRQLAPEKDQTREDGLESPSAQRNSIVSEKELVTLTIDGQTVQAPKGTALIEAARQAGIKIPYYCYHPGLSVVGNCRMCLVEIEKIPKLQPSCATPVAEGLVIRTQTPEALRNRQSVLEFLLLNHPLDCPVCDQSGECELQNYYMDHGAYDPRFDENKTKRKKAFPIGPTVILDQERCILCTRCVRFTREISKTGELAVHDRGHLSEIDLFPGVQLDNPYSGNVVDICPVGALTDRDFRFQCRVWFLGRANSVCPGCSRGCNIEIHYNERFNARYHDKRVHRLKPRYNKDVNGYWMCDEGRYAYHAIDSADRLRRPMLRQGDRWQEVTWDDAIKKTAAELRESLQKYGPDGVAVLASPQMTNEELYSLRQIFKNALNIRRLEYRVPLRRQVYSDDILITADKNPNSRGAEELGLSGAGSDELLRACAEGRVHFVFIFYHDLTTGFDAQEVLRSLSNVGFVAFQGSWEHPTASMAQVLLPASVYAEKEGTFTNLEGRIQRILPAVPPLGESLPDLEILSRLAAELDVPLKTTLPEEIFREIGEREPPFAGMTYATVGEAGQPITRDFEPSR
jgi:NADH-quinone oxidoreductase subunit G